VEKEDVERLKYARLLLEHPSFFAKVGNVIGIPVERALAFLPNKWQEVVANATHKALATALRVAVSTMNDKPSAVAYNKLHKWAATATGTVGGAFGLPALAVELPISTTIMLRSIADVARSEGESIKSVEAKLACLEVFALGGGAKSDDASETGYFVVRASLAEAMAKAAKHVAQKGLAKESAPAVLRLITLIGNRFGIAVSEKAAAQAVPAIGAVGGGLINLVFIDHYQDIARGHFIVRMLERKYGPEAVRKRYDSL
jgi:hypothetical protein